MRGIRQVTVVVASPAALIACAVAEQVIVVAVIAALRGVLCLPSCNPAPSIPLNGLVAEGGELASLLCNLVGDTLTLFLPLSMEEIGHDACV